MSDQSKPDDSNSPSVDGPQPAGVPSSDELQKAMKAFKKRLKLARLDADSSLGRGPMSSGGRSKILSVAPPSQFPKAVWDELVKRGRLRYVGNGLYEPADQ